MFKAGFKRTNAYKNCVRIGVSRDVIFKLFTLHGLTFDLETRSVLTRADTFAERFEYFNWLITLILHVTTVTPPGLGFFFPRFSKVNACEYSEYSVCTTTNFYYSMSSETSDDNAENVTADDLYERSESGCGTKDSRLNH